MTTNYYTELDPDGELYDTYLEEIAETIRTPISPEEFYSDYEYGLRGDYAADELFWDLEADCS